MKPIARREVFLVDRNTEREHHIAFEIMPPYAVDDGANYLCDASVTGDVEESFAVGGVDSLQALMLAVQRLDAWFEEKNKSQYDFYWPDRSNPMQSFDLVREDLKKLYEM